jgi:acyl carrier protein
MTVTTEQILEIIRKADIPEIDADTLQSDVTFRDQGIDSLDAMSIYLNVEETFGFKIPDEDIEGLNSVAALAAYASRAAA